MKIYTANNLYCPYFEPQIWPESEIRVLSLFLYQRVHDNQFEDHGKLNAPESPRNVQWWLVVKIFRENSNFWNANENLFCAIKIKKF